jgi:hypothetical protein
VNLVELACTAGLPLLYTRILTIQDLSPWGHYGHLALDDAADVDDDATVLTIAVAALSRLKLQERAGRVLKLPSAAVMIALAAMLFIRPDWL